MGAVVENTSVKSGDCSAPKPPPGGLIATKLVADLVKLDFL
jgi:hypothetical protein